MSEMIGRLRVALGLETASFEKGAKRATAEINTLGSTTEKAALHVGKMGKAVIAAGGAFVASSLVSSLKSTVEESLRSIKAMKELAQVSNSSLAEFQAVAFAAGTVGVEMDKLADIYKDMNDRVGEFLSTGSGPMKDFFDKIAPKVGVTAEQFKNLSGPQALQLYVSSLEKAGVNQQQMTFYLEAMSGDLTKLLPLLQNNGAGMNRLSEEARRMGIVLDDNLVKNAGEASRTMDTLNTVLSMQITAAVAANAKEIAAFTTTLTNFAISAIKAFNAWNQFNGAMDERAIAQKKLAEKIDQRAKEQGLSPERKAKALEVGNRVLDNIYGVAPVSQGPGLTNNPLFRLKSVTPKNNFAATSGPIGNGAIGMMAGMAPGRGAGLGERLSGSAAIATMLGDESIATNIDEVNAKLTALQDRMGTMSIETERASVMVSQSFEEMAQNSIYALDRLASAVQGGGALNVLSAILGLGVQVAGMFPGKTNLPTGAQINTSTLDILRGTNLNPNVQMPAYANGTNFHPGGLALVGERGPEILRMPRGSSVTPNHALGGVTNYYFEGNVMSADFWAQINTGHAVAAQAGGELGYRKVVAKGRRRLS